MEDSIQKVVMTYLLLQLDSLSTLDVCMVLYQKSSFSHSVDYKERLTERVTMKVREELMRQFENYGIRSP